MLKKVSLYIPCYNAERYIEKCLNSILAQTIPPYEIIVVDDGSTDQTVAKVQKFPVKLITHSKNLGLGAARNTGVKAATGDFVAAVDSDCLLDKDWLANILLCLEGDIVGVSGKVIEVNQSVVDRWRAVRMKQHWGEGTCEPDFLFGANTIYNKKIIQEVGGYNDKYKTNYEDFDICRKMRKAGYRFIYTSKAVVSHLKEDTIVSVLKNYWRWNFHYFAKEKECYLNKDNFKEKLIDNAGVSNRFLQEDMERAEKDFLYLDFLLAPYLFLQDLLYLYHKRGEYGSCLGGTYGWFYLFDTALLVYLEKNKKKYKTLVKKEYLFEQSLFSAILVHGCLVKRILDSSELAGVLVIDLMRIFVHKEDVSALVVRKLMKMSAAHFDWQFLCRQSDRNIDYFLFKEFFNFLDNCYVGLGIKFSDFASDLRESVKKY